MDKKYVLGIDFGTSNCAAAFFRDGVPVTVRHQNNSIIFPSVVAFKGNERLLGCEAKNEAIENPVNTIFEVKRIMGKQFNDPEVQEDISRMPYSVVSKNGQLGLKVNYKGGSRVFRPESIAAMILTAIKENAEKQLGTPVTDAVITVPAAYTQSQRQATKDAATIAGLNIIKLINEPTAAAISYGYMNEVEGGKMILVFDFGGGTFDVSIVQLKSEQYTVLATDGDSHLGGSDITQRLKELVLKKASTLIAESIQNNPFTHRKLLTNIESAKLELSEIPQTNIVLGNILPEGEIRVAITRAELNIACNDLFDRIVKTIQRVLDEAKLQKQDIDDVVFIGGASKTARIRTLLADFFPNVQFKSSIDPHLAVAQGAAIQGESLLKSKQNMKQPINITDVVPLSLGIRIVGGKMYTLISRNTPLPAKASKIFTTFKDNQTHINFKVYEGERMLIKDNCLLSEFIVDGIPPGPPKKENVEVTFEVNIQGMLNVTAVLCSNRKIACNIVNITRLNLQKEHLTQLIQEAEDCKKNDLCEESRIAAKTDLEMFVYESMAKYKDNDKLMTECSRTLKWSQQNQQMTTEDFIKKKKELLESLPK